MKRISPLWRCVLFLLPVAVVLGTPALVLWLAGELTSPDRVVARQLESNGLVLHGVAYTDRVRYVKARRLSQRPAQLLALGNSRVMQFRAEFFRPPQSFYNAGGCVKAIQQFRGFLERLPAEALPRTLLIATDTAYFHRSFDPMNSGTGWLDRDMAKPPAAADIYLANWRQVWSDILAGKIVWSRLRSFDGLTSRVGLAAVCREQGYRNDGSYLHSSGRMAMTNPLHGDYQFANTLKCVARGSDRFPWGDTPNPDALRETELLLEFCRLHRIDVVGFLPPHPHAVWAAIQQAGPKYAYIAALAPALRTRFEKCGFEFYDFSDFAAFGAPDSEALDGFHGSERAYLRLLISMLEQGSRLNAYADLAELRALLAAYGVRQSSGAMGLVAP